MVRAPRYSWRGTRSGPPAAGSPRTELRLHGSAPLAIMTPRGHRRPPVRSFPPDLARLTPSRCLTWTFARERLDPRSPRLVQARLARELSMSYVIYTSHAALTQRSRTPLRKCLAWMESRLAGTVLQQVLGSLLKGPVITRYSVAILCGLLIGLLFDFSISIVWPGAPSTIACAALACVVGLLAQGAGGAIVGLIWGWLIGGLADSISSEFISEQTTPLRNKVVAWIVTCIASWYIGLLVEKAYDYLERRHKKIAKWIRRVLVVVILGSVGGLLVPLAPILVLPSTYIEAVHWIISNWRIVVILLCWALVLATLISLFISWLGHGSRQLIEHIVRRQSYEPYAGLTLGGYRHSRHRTSLGDLYGLHMPLRESLFAYCIGGEGKTLAFLVVIALIVATIVHVSLQ